MFRYPTLTSKQFAFLLFIVCVLSTRRDTSCEGRDAAELAIPVLAPALPLTKGQEHSLSRGNGEMTQIAGDDELWECNQNFL